MKTIIKQSELIFWDTLTSIMAHSKFIQKSIRVAYPIFQGIDLRKMIRAITISGFSGFATGWVVYLLLLFLQG